MPPRASTVVTDHSPPPRCRAGCYHKVVESGIDGLCVPSLVTDRTFSAMDYESIALACEGNTQRVLPSNVRVPEVLGSLRT